MNPFFRLVYFAALICLTISPVVHAQQPSPASHFDVLIKNGTVYDGSGGEGRLADVAIQGDRIVGVGNYH